MFPTVSELRSKKAKELSNKTEDLMLEVHREFEKCILAQIDGGLSVRGVEYTPEVREAVTKELAKSGWKTKFDGYWLRILPE